MLQDKQSWTKQWFKGNSCGISASPGIGHIWGPGLLLKSNPLFSRPEHNCSVKRAAIVGEGVKLVNHLPFLNCQRWWGGTRGTSSQTHLTQPSLALVGNAYKSCICSLSTFNCLRFRIMEMSSTELSTLGKLNWTSLDLGVSPLNSVVMMIGPFWLQIRN